jgi:glycosyltransferase involved in cell wall biosynthesis
MKFIYPAITFDHTNPLTNNELIGNYLIRTFEKHGYQSEVITENSTFLPLIYGIKKYFIKFILGKNYLHTHEPNSLKKLTKKINDQINNSDADFVFAFGSLPVAYLETDKPIYFLTDATFMNLVDYYHFNLQKSFIERNNELEKIAFEKARKIFFSTQWAAESAINFYNIPKDKIEVVPLGANIQSSPNKSEIVNIINKRASDELRFVIIGKDWDRKGAELAIDFCRKLNENSLNSNLTIIGMTPKKEVKYPWLKIIPFIDKSNDSGKKLFSKILEDSHYLLFPSIAETFGHVICEANAYGIPVIGQNTGGIPEVVRDGVNGYVIDFNNDYEVEQLINTISTNIKDFNKYSELAINSFDEYSSKLNWDYSIKLMIKAIHNSL